MLELFEHPIALESFLPLLVALVVAAALCRTRHAWLAIAAGYAAIVAITTGFSFTPPSAARKLMLVVLLSPLVGLIIDVIPRPSRAIAPILAVAAGGISTWVFVSVLSQREGMAGYAAGAGIALFVAALVYAVVRQRDDGLRAGATGLGLGVATGLAGFLSASVGFLLTGAAVAQSASAVLLVQVIFSRSIAAGYTGTLPIGVATALFAVGTMLLAELRWFILPLLLLVPAAVALPVPGRAPRIVRAALLAGYALAAAAIPILAAWYSARGSFG